MFNHNVISINAKAVAFVPPVGSNYAEWSYFDGYHFAHIAARNEHLRIQRKRTEAIKMLDRRNFRR